MRTPVILALCGLAASAPAIQPVPLRAAASIVSRPADLRSHPGGPRTAILLPGSSLVVVEQRDGWARVTLDGWVAQEDLAEAPPGGASPPEPLARGSAISGTIHVISPEGLTRVGASVAVRLLRDAPSLLAEVASIRTECDSARARLLDDAARLKREAARAMMTTGSSSEAFQNHDAAMKRRATALREAKDLEAACSRRVEQSLESATLARTLTDDAGRYMLERVPVGDHALHAAMEADAALHEWLVPVGVTADEPLTLDLTPSNRTRRAETPPQP